MRKKYVNLADRRVASYPLKTVKMEEEWQEYQTIFI